MFFFYFLIHSLDCILKLANTEYLAATTLFLSFVRSSCCSSGAGRESIDRVGGVGLAGSLVFGGCAGAGAAQ